MSRSAIQLAIQVIADSLTIRLTNPSLLSSLEEIGESHIRSLLSDLVLLSHSLRSTLLQEHHLRMVLELRHLPPLLGYSSVPNYSAFPICVEQTNVFGLTEIPCILTEVIVEPVPALQQNSFHPFRWICVDGYFPIARIAHRRRDRLKSLKPIERTASTPNLAVFGHSEIPRTLSVAREVEKPPPDVHKYADEVLSPHLQQFFITFVNLLRSDTAYTFTRAIEQLSVDDQIHRLVPYFIQLAFGKFTENFQEPQIILSIVELTIAISKNPFINIVFFTHPILKIAFTGMLSVLGNELESPDFPIRSKSAVLLKIICSRSKSGFPGIYESVINSLLSALFNPDISLAAHLGALLGMTELGSIALYRFIPHLPIYLQHINLELQTRDPTQKLIIPLVLMQIQEAIQVYNASART